MATVTPVPCLQDNYAYLLVDDQSGTAAAVDPVNADRVLQAARRANTRITHVLTTHHHADHSGGNEAMKRELGDGVEVVGGDSRIPALQRRVEDGDTLQIGKNLRVTAMQTPCHTRGHVCYYVTSGEDSSPPNVFTGDTLFVAGCGRFFEGDARQMNEALQKLAKLPSNTQVWVGHEYTVKNLQFAMTVDGDNSDVQKRLKWAEERRAEGEPTVPSTIGEELKTNPFMRVQEAALQSSTAAQDSVEVMAELRKQKDRF